MVSPSLSLLSNNRHSGESRNPASLLPAPACNPTRVQHENQPSAKNDRTLKKVLDSVTLDRHVLDMVPKVGRGSVQRKMQDGRVLARLYFLPVPMFSIVIQAKANLGIARMRFRQFPCPPKAA
jgi:hypothetical protein